MSNIKKICAFLLVTLIMTGCANEILEETPQESAFSISKETQNLYLSEIQKKLDEFYWRYDQDSLTFEPGFMPSKDLDNYDTLISCFESANVNYANKESLPAVIADITLLYYNGDIGGTGRFYFVEEELCGAYYSAPYDERTVFGLKERNIFLSSVQFEQYESGTEYDKHTKSTPSIPISGFGAEGGDGKGNKLFASIDTEHQIINIYTFVRSFTLTKTLKTQEPEYPVSAAFISNASGPDLLAVLIGEHPQESLEFSDEHIEGAERLNSKYILFYDKDYKEYSRLELSSNEYTMIAYEDEHLILGASNGLEYYTNTAGVWTRSSKIQLAHSVKSYLKTNIFNDTKIYLMSDGLDLYMYTKNTGSFINIWRTHISIENFTGSIYAADLNHDGVKEIYAFDSTNTSIRYILSTRGLVPQNSDILYGERIYPADFNSDGKDDYIKVIDPETDKIDLYVAD